MLAGGTALNCSVNERLLCETPFRSLFIPPTPGDGGTALGCAVYGLTELAERRCEFRWRDDYLGPPPDAADIEAALRDADDLLVERVDGLEALCARMVDLLATNKALALFQGRSEFGPRALGHRSILADPRSERMRDWINARVKQREWFRPLAPAVLLERAGEYFDLMHPAPFMQFAVPVTPFGAERLGATTHIDRSARLQSVGPDDDACCARCYWRSRRAPACRCCSIPRSTARTNRSSRRRPRRWRRSAPRRCTRWRCRLSWCASASNPTRRSEDAAVLAAMGAI